MLFDKYTYDKKIIHARKYWDILEQKGKKTVVMLGGFWRPDENLGPDEYRNVIIPQDTLPPLSDYSTSEVKDKIWHGTYYKKKREVFSFKFSIFRDEHVEIHISVTSDIDDVVGLEKYVDTFRNIINAVDEYVPNKNVLSVVNQYLVLDDVIRID